MALVNAVQQEEERIKSEVETQSNNGHAVITTLNEVNALITRIKDESSELLISGRSMLSKLNTLKGSI
jgi:hypothetical protein